MQHRVFVSYSSIDTDQVDKLVEVFRGIGVAVIRDKYDFQPGEDIGEAIARVVKSEADVVAIAMSNHALTSPWVKKEEQAAEQVRALGCPVDILYVNISEKTNVPGRIQSRIYIDLARRKRDDYSAEILKMCGFFLSPPATRRLGIYDTYSDTADLDKRRENGNGAPGYTIDDYLVEAKDSIVGVGLWFGILFGPDQASTLAQRLRDVPDLDVDLYMPNPNAAAMGQLAGIHEARRDVLNRLPEFIEGKFKPWGENRGLNASQAQRCRLHFLSYIPTASFMCVDPLMPTGRLILDLYTPAIKPSDQLKIELRYPETPVYRKYLQSLRYIQSSESVTNTITTSHA